MKVVCIYKPEYEYSGGMLCYISLESGKEVERIALPSDHDFYSGMEWVECNRKVREFTTQVCTGPRKPTLDTLEYNGPRRMRERFFKIKPIKIEEIDYDKNIMPTWTVKVTWGVYDTIRERRFRSSEDEFRQDMERLGFDMTGWCTYKRIKVGVDEFFKTMAQQRKDYEIVNIVEIR